VLLAQERWGTKFAAKGLLLAPNGRADVYNGEIAANICLETPGLDTLDILVLWKGFPTYASTQTIFTILKANWYYLVQNKFVEWDVTAISRLTFPVSTRAPSPCRGVALRIRSGSRTIRACPTAGCSRRHAARRHVGCGSDPGDGEEKIKPLPPTSRRRRWPTSRQRCKQPCRRARIRASILRSIRLCIGTTRSRSLRDPRELQLQADRNAAGYAAFSLLQTAPRKVGFASACQAFGHGNC